MGQLGSSSVFQYAEFGVESSWSLGLKLSAAAAARSDFIWILFFLSLSRSFGNYI